MRAAPIKRSWSAPELAPAVAAPGLSARGAAVAFARRRSRARSTRAAAVRSGARPWVEFADLSAFGLAEGGFAAYVERVQANVSYFRWNYLRAFANVLGLSIICTLTMRQVLRVGAAVLACIFFLLFWVVCTERPKEHTNDELNHVDRYNEMRSVFVVLSSLLSWFLAGGFSLLLTIVTAAVFIIVAHSALRNKPSPEYAPLLAQAL